MNEDEQPGGDVAGGSSRGRRQTAEVVVKPKPKLKQKRAAPSLPLSTPKSSDQNASTSNPKSER